MKKAVRSVTTAERHGVAEALLAPTYSLTVNQDQRKLLIPRFLN